MPTDGVRAAATAAAFALVALIPAPAAAQEPATSRTGRVIVSGTIDFLNAYAFRGIRQDDTGVIVWPSVNIGVRAYEGGGVLKALIVSMGTWSSLHTGIAGADGPSGDRWYESDVRALDFALAGGVSIGTAYTTYTSPNEMFTTVKEIALKVAVDDRAVFGRGAVQPYALVAFELDTQTGVGQADGGFEAGKYLEVGAVPRFSHRALDIAVPVKVGLSLGGYYELAGYDHTLGYVSTSAVVTVPLGARRANLGAWNVHGGVEFQALGDMTKAINKDEATNLIGSIGIGWAR